MSESLTPHSPPCQTKENLSDFSPRHAVWDRRKSEGDTVSEILLAAPDMRNRSQRIHDCSDHLILKRTIDTGSGVIEAQAHSAKCRDRACPICQQARSIILKQELSAAFRRLLEDHPKARFLFVTLTVRNCPVTELKATLKRMNAAFIHNLAQGHLFKTRIQGWTRTTEVTRGEDDTAHPHFHCIFVVTPSYFTHKYITQSAWADCWRTALGVDYSPVVDIRAVKDVNGALLEVTKISGYSVKVDDALHRHADWFVEYQRQVKGSRFFAAGGWVKKCLSAIRQPGVGDDIAEPSPSSQGNPDTETSVAVFDWNRPVKKYKKRTIQD